MNFTLDVKFIHLFLESLAEAWMVDRYVGVTPRVPWTFRLPCRRCCVSWPSVGSAANKPNTTEKANEVRMGAFPVG